MREREKEREEEEKEGEEEERGRDSSRSLSTSRGRKRGRKGGGEKRETSRERERKEREERRGARRRRERRGGKGRRKGRGRGERGGGRGREGREGGRGEGGGGGGREGGGGGERERGGGGGGGRGERGGRGRERERATGGTGGGERVGGEGEVRESGRYRGMEREKVLHSRERVEDQVRARDLARVRRGVRPLHLAVIDQHQRAVGVADGVDPGAVGAGDLALRVEVGQQRHGQVELLAKGPVRVARVHADPDQRRALRLDLGQDLLVEAELTGAHRAEVERIERDHQLAIEEVAERDRVSVLIGQREVGCARAGLDHVARRR